MWQTAIIEDDPAAKETLQGHLEQYALSARTTFDITDFPSGEAFLAQERHFDLVFMDIDLPGVNGLLANRGSLIEEMELLNVLHDRERKQMNLSREYSELINIKAHDLKRRLEQPEKALSEEERAELKALLDAYSDRYHTENETFNLILNETVMRCERAGIDFHCMADVPLLDGMRSGDLYSLLGNALENAVEAAAKCGAERYIRVNIASVAEMLSIHIENTFAGQLATENGKLRTTKPDPSGHGFGVRSMEWIVKRYDGTMTFSDANGIFSEDILLPLPLARKKDDIPQTVLSR